ncbi:hypothetical protein UM396_12590 [Geobacillus subterraneus]|uniref:hypothetical protein n=1 Tax=Geobacillus subterraneus TaxID=129338 RepID=UPI002AC96D73|nr:hypothetical protein [Geobacillus subterraneus]WPZ17425.1 hypothetical protein UM396_12590 [Geobacillus subterraneus]
MFHPHTFVPAAEAVGFHNACSLHLFILGSKPIFLLISTNFFIFSSLSVSPSPLPSKSKAGRPNHPLSALVPLPMQQPMTAAPSEDALDILYFSTAKKISLFSRRFVAAGKPVPVGRDVFTPPIILHRSKKSFFSSGRSTFFVEKLFFTVLDKQL